MDRLLYRLTVAAAFFIVSCSSGQPKKETQKAAEPDSTILKYVKNLEEKDTTETADYDAFVPKVIDQNALGAIKVINKKSFDVVLALQQLFPGTYSKAYDPANENDSILISAWTCRNCPRELLSGWYGEDSELVPYSEGNITRVADTVMFTDDLGKTNIIVSFSTIRLQNPEFMFSGRFICAVLGLALYTNEQNQWMLKSFAPQLGCYGAFQTLPDLHLLKLGKNNFGCYFLNTNGGAGGPFYSDLYVYGLADGKFKLLLSDTNVKRSRFGFNGWDELLVGSNNELTPGDIILTLNGGYDKKEFQEEQDSETNIPAEVQGLVKTKNHFSFKVTRQYKFAKSGYKMSDSKMEVK